MIISQTPYRVSFGGGGTDLPAFYQMESGAVISAAVERHIYVSVHPRFERNYRLAYSKIEVANSIDEIQHELIREALRVTGIDEFLEITTIGDVPAGTGMGSSSSLTVGLLVALYAYQGRIVSSQRLAEEACRIEIDILKKPIGRQDQYAAAYGGLNLIRFHPDATVEVEPIACRAETIDELESQIVVLYTNASRSADGILKKQQEAAPRHASTLRDMRNLAEQMRMTLSGAGDVQEFSNLLAEGWRLKRSLGCGITNNSVDEMYEAALRLGAKSGKLLGAGGGGFLLLLAPPERHQRIWDGLGKPIKLPLRFARRGGKTIFMSS
ncbi:D-glycero-alpha-D-manno-heptose 7-phosphate kinase [Anatilimnocola aggregata]|uniref:D-glycero-alpha-D-manno-heptose 7-phosphate kinase n=1 Tax=Anatilimnocola aggregata TaxID=2528021 RepID=A0A517YAE7_9BACT|nr:GHMP kinase [Anatilimnocola aggregata]QDU27132.1 D-glycero-alpha-D-manno-heptose 7-phosphate kinase [Anatilimnocola aggregata]